MTSAVPGRAMALAATIFVVDQAVKYFVTVHLGLGRLAALHEVAPIFDLRFVSNCGVSLGLFQADSAPMRWLLVALTGGIATAVTVWLTREKNRVDQLALAAVVGGALGNIADRVLPPGVLGKVNTSALAYPGCVIDYADLHFGEWRPFLVFNVADAAITIGVLILLARAVFVREKPAQTPETYDA